MKFLKIVGSILGVLLLIGFCTSDGGNRQPYTYQDLARDKAAECVRNKGYGNWVGSMGMTLEKFCEAAGNLSALQQHRKDHPEKY
jgi:hypothetical protein